MCNINVCVILILMANDSNIIIINVCMCVSMWLMIQYY